MHTKHTNHYVTWKNSPRSHVNRDGHSTMCNIIVTDRWVHISNKTIDDKPVCDECEDHFKWHTGQQKVDKVTDISPPGYKHPITRFLRETKHDH